MKLIGFDSFREGTYNQENNIYFFNKTVKLNNRKIDVKLN